MKMKRKRENVRNEKIEKKDGMKGKSDEAKRERKDERKEWKRK